VAEENGCKRCDDMGTVPCATCPKDENGPGLFGDMRAGCCGVGTDCPECWPAGNYPGTGPVAPREVSGG
jgi:hypothetical protein